MKQLINNCLKNNQLFNFAYYKRVLFKQSCLLCVSGLDAEAGNLKANPHAVCRACLNDLPWHSKSSCPQCGLAWDGTDLNSTVCGSCISAPPNFDATHAVFLYQFPVDVMMQRYKYGNSLNIGDTFGQFLSDKLLLEENSKKIDLIIPMPMHPQRLKERGFNQAIEIVKALNKDLTRNRILDYKSAIRQKLAPPQASLPLKERVKNIKGAFKIKADLTGKTIAIVDDVMTSGASLNELAKTLKKAGAARVECWVVARTMPHK
jgi:ComF family protein